MGSARDKFACKFMQMCPTLFSFNFNFQFVSCYQVTSFFLLPLRLCRPERGFLAKTSRSRPICSLSDRFSGRFIPTSAMTMQLRRLFGVALKCEIICAPIAHLIGASFDAACIRAARFLRVHKDLSESGGWIQREMINDAHRK